MTTYKIRRWYGTHGNPFDQITIYREDEDRPFLSLRIEQGAELDLPDGAGLEPALAFKKRD